MFYHENKDGTYTVFKCYLIQKDKKEEEEAVQSKKNEKDFLSDFSVELSPKIKPISEPAYGCHIIKAILSKDEFISFQKTNKTLVLSKDPSHPIFESAAAHLAPLITSPYKPDTFTDKSPSFWFTLEMGGRTTNRPNHGVAHSLRVAHILPEFVDFFRKYHPKRFESDPNFTEENMPLLQAAMMHTVVGRENEVGWSKTPKHVLDLCERYKDRIYDHVMPVSNRKSEWVIGDMYELLYYEKIQSLTEENIEILEACLKIIENSIQKDNWIKGNKDFCADFDKIIQEKDKDKDDSEKLYPKLKKLTQSLGKEGIGEIYQYYPAMLVMHHQKCKNSSPVVKKERGELFGKMRAQLSPGDLSIIQHQAVQEQLNQMTYSKFRENSANAFRAWCEGAKLSPDQLAICQKLYIAIRFMGNPRYKGSQYFSGARHAGDEFAINSFCTLMSLVHDADLGRCFPVGGKSHFDEVLECLPVGSREKAKDDAISLFLEMSACQSITGDVILERIFADGSFEPHSGKMRYAPHFIDCNNNFEFCLSLLDGIPKLISPIPKLEGMPIAISSDRPEAGVISIQFKTEEIANQFIAFLKKNDLFSPSPDSAIQLEVRQTKEGLFSIRIPEQVYRDKVHAHMNFALPEIPKNFSLERELFEKEPSWKSVVHTGRAVLKSFDSELEDTPSGGKQPKIDFLLKQINNPWKYRPIPRVRNKEGEYVPVRRIGEQERYNPKTELYETFPIGEDILYQPITTATEARDHSERPGRQYSLVSGQIKPSVFTKKTAWNLVGLLGKFYPFMDRNFFILSDRRLMHDKGWKFPFRKNALTDEKPHIRDPERAESPKDRLQKLYWSEKDLQADLEAEKEVRPEINNEFLLGATKTAIRAFGSSKADPQNRLLAAFPSAYARQKYGIDVPVLIMDGDSPPKAYRESELEDDLLAVFNNLNDAGNNFTKQIMFFLEQAGIKTNDRRTDPVTQALASRDAWKEFVKSTLLEHINLLTSSTRARKLKDQLKEASTQNKINFLKNQIEIGNIGFVYECICENRKEMTPLLFEMDPNIASADGETLLFAAIVKKDVLLIQALLSTDRINVNQEWRGNTPLMAALHGKDKGIIEALLATGKFSLSTVNNDGRNMLMIALAEKADKEIIQWLLKRQDWDLTQTDKKGRNTLMIALEKKADKEIVEELLATEKFDLSQVDNKGRNILKIALGASADKEIIEALWRKFNFDLTEINKDVFEALEIVSKYKFDIEILKVLLTGEILTQALTKADRSSNSALMIAILNKDRGLIEVLLSKKELDLTYVNNTQKNALMIALEEGNNEIILLLLKREGWDLTQTDQKGRNILMIALEETANKEIILLLLEREGWDLTQTDQKGRNILMIALEKKAGKEIVEALLATDKFDLSQVDNNGRNILKIALKASADKEILDALWRKFHFNLTEINEDVLKALKIVLENKFDMEIIKVLLTEEVLGEILTKFEYESGYNALMIAILNGNIEVTEMLLSRKELDLTYVNESGQNALMLALEEGNNEIILLLLKREDWDLTQKDNARRNMLMIAMEGKANIKITLLLLKREGWDLTQADRRGRNTLMVALDAKADIKIIEALLAKKGLNLNHRDRNKKNALELALDKRIDKEIIKLMLRKKGWDFSRLNDLEKTKLLEKANVYEDLELTKLLKNQFEGTAQSSILTRFHTAKNAEDSVAEQEEIGKEYVLQLCQVKAMIEEANAIMELSKSSPTTAWDENSCSFISVLKRQCDDFGVVDESENKAALMNLELLKKEINPYKDNPKPLQESLQKIVKIMESFQLGEESQTKKPNV